MNIKQKKSLYESIMASVAKTVKKTLNEGAGAGYTVTINDLKLGNFKILGTEFINNNHKVRIAKFKADILPCVVEWSAEGYYDGVDHEGVYYNNELMMEYTDDDNTVEGGNVTGYVYLDDISNNTPTKSEIIEYLQDYASSIDISTMYGGGWSHVDLGSPVFTFNDLQIDGNYYDIEIDQINIKAPNIADNVNWYFKNSYRFDEIFVDDFDEDEDEE